MGLRTQANAKWDSFKLKLRFDRSLRPCIATTLTDLRLRYIEGMDKIYALLIVAAAIAIIFLAGRWNTSDADHYMGFGNLRPRRKRQGGDDDTQEE
ncbi:hypothetical protein CO660_18390 [Rhizobium sp. L9]|uniref:hypothetical protein n=1 Tax=Rhizobium sp. L9 TaxID=1340738 RepID=UPI000BEA954C|nr:hypothetical protein [Rhizobium sp. L9]PDT28428.1 hypothetical protein CO660_18390 [Rhizobium sp. L9]